MSKLEYIKLLNEFESKPFITLTEWQRVLNFNFDNIENNINAGVINITTKTDTATLLSSEFGLVLCNKPTAMTLTLPAAAGNINKSFFITNMNTGTVTIDANGSETIQGDLTFDLYQDENINIISNGSGWYLR